MKIVQEERYKKSREGKMCKTFNNCEVLCIQCARVTKVGGFVMLQITYISLTVV